MSDIKDGGPAFPIPLQQGQSWQGMAPCDGMTLRDYFAVHASDSDLKDQGEILRYLIREAKGVEILPDDWRVTARYMHADAMLKAREAK